MFSVMILAASLQASVSQVRIGAGAVVVAFFLTVKTTMRTMAVRKARSPTTISDFPFVDFLVHQLPSRLLMVKQLF